MPVGVGKATFALLAGLCLMPCARADADRAALVLAGAKVLKVEALRQQGGYSLGSAVLLGEGRVATNCHVTQDAVRVDVLRGDQRWRADAQARDTEHDLCVLRVPGLAGEAGVALGSGSELKPGQSVTALGYTGGQGLQNSSGRIVSLHPHDGGRVIQTDNFFNSGASGGALLDEQLRLIGVLTFRLRGGHAHYFAAPAEWLQPLLDGRVAFRAVAPGDARGLPYWQKPVERQPPFLQAGALERERRWAELQALGARWSLSDSADPVPLVWQGLALERLGRLPEAQMALERALALEPGDSAVLLRLGRLYARQGARERVLDVRRRLERLAPDLLPELDARPAGS